MRVHDDTLHILVVSFSHSKFVKHNVGQASTTTADDLKPICNVCYVCARSVHVSGTLFSACINLDEFAIPRVDVASARAHTRRIDLACVITREARCGAVPEIAFRVSVK